MISAELKADRPVEALSMEAGYLRTAVLLDALNAVLPEPAAWFGGINAAHQHQVPFADREATLQRAQQRAEISARKFPQLPHAHGYAAYLSNREAVKKRTPGLIELALDPTLGLVSLDLHQPDACYGQAATRICRDLLTAVAACEPVTFGYVNVRDRAAGTGRVVTYRLNYATFPHRRALGWMGFVPAEVAPAQLPLAAELVSVAGKGTVIVAVDAPFDLNDPAHIRRANQVEMDMVDLGLLPVTDPDYR